MFKHLPIFDQGQPRVIIWKILVILKYPVLHIKFQSHPSVDSGGEDFKGFTIYGQGCHTDHVTWTVCTNFRSSYPWRLYMKFDYYWPNAFWGDDLNRMWVLGQRSKNYHDLLYSQIFMYSLKQLYIPFFRPTSTKFSMKSYILAYLYIWPRHTKSQGQPMVII